MTLLIATGVYPPESGGPATYTKLLEERLPRHGIDVQVLPFRVVRHLPMGVRHFVYFWRCFVMLRRVDFVFAQDTVSVGVPAALASFLARKPLLVRVPGDYAWEQGTQRFGIRENIDDFQRARYGLRVEILRALQRFTVTRARRIVAPSQYLKHIVVGWGVPEERVAIITNGVDILESPILPTSRPEGFLIVTVARLVKWKGIDALIEIIAKEKTWSLVVVGDGPEHEALEKSVQEHDLRKQVQFLGRLSHAEALGWMQESDVFVLNSSYEGFSHVLIEAMWLGRPIVASDAGGNPEIIHNDVDGILVPVHDVQTLHTALGCIASDAQLAARLGETAHERAQNFSIEYTLSALSQLLHTI